MLADFYGALIWQVLALYGPGGAGKTRLAEALYRHLSPHFTYRSFTRFAYNAEYSPINGQVMRAQSQLLQVALSPVSPPRVPCIRDYYPAACISHG